MTRSRQPSEQTVSTPTVPTTPARVAFVGAGPGDPGLMTVRGRDLLAAADAVVIDRISRDDVVLRHARPDVEVIDAGHGEQGQELTHAVRAKLLVKAAKAVGPGGLVVRLMDGDPSLWGGLVEEVRACRRASLSFDVVPGVSAVSAVPTYAGIPLTAKGTSAVHIVSADLPGVSWPRYAVGDDTVVVLGGTAAIRTGLRALAAAGRDADTLVSLTFNGTTVGQTSHVVTLDAVDDTLEGHDDDLAMAVVSSTVGLRDELSWFETKPLFGWKVLVPRTQAQAGTMVDRLAGYGATADVVPTISVEPPRTPQQMEKAVKGLVTGRYEWIGFTSVNAVRAVRERFEELGLDARAFAGLKVAAVGGVTAEALREWGINADLVPSGEQSAAGLLEEWPDFDELLDPINRVLLPRADIATETLVAGLRDMGWEVDDVTAYRTVRAAPPAAEIRDAIKGGDYDAVVFTSSSTVRNLVGIAGKPHPATVVACIGPATAKTAQEHGLRVDVLAPEASALSLVDALAGHGVGIAVAAAESGQPVQRPSDKRPASRRRAR
ncbi:uroporphyrinogen-III synthase [Terracoccus luteus]|uniref:uroporphyrinogen-III C-methyltransferase n=1 Tax=Terracoccus luteus TaxID=53356 RepID=A0A495Y0H2_9MICO|nr:uroporphyrinogen-III synthase [Terracoccus luteus]MBB2986164.1 uroporphyrinogen III methyltransferase/synthase [Terracoccus luteus]MCP2172246.1 uroporphyrinogen III methyltransferase/synthase [Terracoccus luteus]RKT78915.1 uroporphyrinogen III methyltransferase/synthase [Terracoccus luteus]